MTGLVAHWSEVGDAEWIAPLLRWEEEERAHRSLQRRIRQARLGHFKTIADFDWAWPKRIDPPRRRRADVAGLPRRRHQNRFVGPNGVGKSTLAQNVAYQALIQGHTVLFKPASQMLGKLAALDSDAALRRRLRHSAAPDVLMIDEVGYLSYSNRHADLLSS
nr:ATP-binding protein [Bradyrhizobium yuanmingense]